MNDSEDPKDLEGLEKHIRMSWDEEKTSTPIEADKPDSEKPAEPSETVHASHEPVHTSSEAVPPAPENSTPPKAKDGLVRQYYRDLMDCLTNPTHFFKERYPKISLSYALAFGIVTLWITNLFEWLTRAVRHETLLEGFTRMRERLQGLPYWRNLPANFWAQGQEGATNSYPAWVPEMFRFTLSPFQSLLHFCIKGFILFIGAWLLIRARNEEKQDSVSLGNFVKLSSLTSAPLLVGALLTFLPFGFGAFLGWVYCLVLLIVGLQIRYQISTLRAIIVMALPGFLAVVLAGALLLAALILGIGLITALFH